MTSPWFQGEKRVHVLPLNRKDEYTEKYNPNARQDRQKPVKQLGVDLFFLFNVGSVDVDYSWDPTRDEPHGDAEEIIATAVIVGMAEMNECCGESGKGSVGGGGKGSFVW